MFGVRETDAAGLKEMIEKDTEKKIRLIDVRSQSEFVRGTIEGAEFLPLHTLPLKLNELSVDDNIVFICSSGNRSNQACMYLAQNTDLEAMNLSRGIMAWYQAGFEVVLPNAAQV